MARKRPSDLALEEERKKKNHQRKDKIDDVISKATCWLIWVGVGVVSILMIWAAGVYICYYTFDGIVKSETIDRINVITTHSFAVISGYLIHLFKRSTGVK